MCDISLIFSMKIGRQRVTSRDLSHNGLARRGQQLKTDARSLIPLFTMPEPSKAAIAVPSKDPKKKEKDEKDGAVPKKKPDEKEGEELVRCI
jgi:hypothetical protein